MRDEVIQALFCDNDTYDGQIEDGYVLNYIRMLEEDPRFLTQRMNQPGNPVYSYTIRPQLMLEGPVLPLVVRAKIDRTTIRNTSCTDPRISSRVEENCQLMGMYLTRPDGNNDEYGHLIGYILGGPTDLYNFVPQTRLLNRGSGSLWYDMEVRILNLVRNGGGWADMTIVVVYPEDGDTRPSGLALNLELYDSNDARLDVFYDDYHFNDPDVMPLTERNTRDELQ